jgi:hypothetical protein
MWDHLPAASVASPATVPSTSRQRDTNPPKLHAFPSGSDVALCGVLKKPGEGASAEGFCRACEGLASSVNHRG